VPQILASEIAPWFVRLFALAFGAAWGSFFNVAIYRWPRGMSVVSPPSHCPACERPVPSLQNLPVLSYLLLRGRAACCGARLSPRYPAVELLGALFCVAVTEIHIVGATRGTDLLDAVMISLCYFAFVGGLVIITFVDLEFMEIPDEVSLPIAALGLVTASFRDAPGGVAAAALGAGGSYLLIQLVFVWAYEQATGRRGMGEGDSKLMLMIGAFIGWHGSLFCLTAGAVQGLLMVAILLILGKRLPDAQSPPADPETVDPLDENGEAAGNGAGDEELDAFGEPRPRYFGHLKVPFGPFLALSALEYLFFGEKLVSSFFGMF
jgi:leader peptidase (prepilin peptidase)/N-methyltransferase